MTREDRIARVESVHAAIEDLRLDRDRDHELADEYREEMRRTSRERFIEDELRAMDERDRAGDINDTRRLLGFRD